MNFQDILNKLTGSATNDPGSMYITAAVVLVALLLLFIIIGIIARTFMKRSPRSIENIPYIDVTTLQKRGILTPEESARVRTALTKQLERQTRKATESSIAGELGLLTDPEVQRLEALAKAKRGETSNPDAEQGDLADPRPQLNERLHTETEGKVPTRPETPRQSRFNALDSIYAENPETEGNTISSTSEARPVPTDTNDDVSLPADVLKMAELGLITPEELERIRERTRAKRNELQ